MPILLIEAIFISLRSDESCWSFRPHLALSALTKGFFFFLGQMPFLGCQLFDSFLPVGWRSTCKKFLNKQQDPIVEHRQVY